MENHGNHIATTWKHLSNHSKIKQPPRQHLKVFTLDAHWLDSFGDVILHHQSHMRKWVSGDYTLLNLMFWFMFSGVTKSQSGLEQESCADYTLYIMLIWTHAVVTMNLLQLHNNIDLFISHQTLLFRPERERERAEVQLGNNGSSLNELSNTQLDSINPHNSPVVCRSEAHKQ